MKNGNRGLAFSLQIAFLAVGALTILEFVFVQGMFTFLIAVGACILVGGANIAVCCKERNWMQALLYLVSTAALCMGYLVQL